MSSNIVLEVKISDYVLTPLACSSLIRELIKCLIYQKCQIPYPYSWLTTTINRRRKRENDSLKDGNNIESRRCPNFTVENHFRIASKLYDNLEEVFKELSNELSDCQNKVNEIVLLFGPTPLYPREVCTIQLPPLAHGHFEEFHLLEASKHQYKALRQVFLSSIWMDSVDSSIPCSNIYVFLRKENDQDDTRLFKACKPPTYKKSVKHYIINLDWEVSREYVCCNNFEIFSESGTREGRRKHEPPVFQSDNSFWFQFYDCLEGFKNCYINKTSASDLW